MRYLHIESLDSKSETRCENYELMFHACFQILKDSVERDCIVMDFSPNRYPYDEIRFLYEWWIKRTKAIRDLTDISDLFGEDDLMFARLMHIREFLNRSSDRNKYYIQDDEERETDDF